MSDRITFATQQLFQIVQQQEAQITQLRARLQELSQQVVTNGRDGLNGKDGKDGIDGKNGKDGVNGTDGKDGIDGKNGKDGVNGTNGKDGIDGVVGKTGATGKAGKAGKNGESFSVDKLTNKDLVTLKAKLGALV
jgi:Ca2+-binding RTX toxin-like protein